MFTENKNLTPFEKIIEKKKEKKKQKKLERKQKQSAEPTGTADEDSSDEVPSDVDLNDPYFAEELNKPEFKKPKEKSKKKQAQESEVDEEEEKRRAELELLLDEDDGKAHFSLKKIQKSEETTKKSKRKRKLKEQMKEKTHAVPDFEINLNDERFSAVFNSHLYNIDPSDPNFKKTKNMERLIQEKLKRRPADSPAGEVLPKKSKAEAEMSMLVKNIKRKIKK